MDFNAAKSYITEKLGVEYVVDKSVLLNKVIKAYYEKVPFQNISVSLLAPEDRFPSEQTVIESGTTLKGGLCVHKNWFFKILVEALGYNVFFISGSVQQPPSKTKRPTGGHMAIVVKDLTKEGDLHLVDTGCGYPFLAPVDLHQLPFTTTDITMTYRIVEENGEWHREHKDDSSETYTRFMTYEKTPRPNSDFFRKPMLEMLIEDWLIEGITAVRYLQSNSPDIPDIPDFKREHDYAVVFKNDTIIFKNSSGFEYKEKVTRDQFAFTIEEYFPTIPSDDISKKIEILNQQASEQSQHRPWYQCRVL